MTDGYHYPYNEHYTPAKIQVDIDMPETVGLKQQKWLNTCLSHSKDTHIQNELSAIEQDEAQAEDYRNEYNELPQKERGLDLVRK